MRYTVCCIVVLLTVTDAWSPLSRGSSGGAGHGGDGAASNHNPWMGQDGSEEDRPFSQNWLLSSLIRSHNTQETTELRGGGAPGSNQVVKGSKNTLQRTAAFWSDAWKSRTAAISKSLSDMRKRVTSVFQSEEQKLEKALIERMKGTPVQSVVAPNSTVLPPDVVAVAARRSGMIGNPLSVESVQGVARDLKQWYTRKGYVLSSVMGATLKADSATAELEVQEPKISKMPVGITFCKEMVIEDDDSLVTYRKYREKHALRKTFGYEKIDKADLNMTFVETSGRTNPQKIAEALKLKPGRPFRWDGNRWDAVASSGIFSRVLKASPEPTSDGTVQLHILATEAPPRNLEYGISNSIYTGSWEGEVDFEHRNLFGGGESLGLIVCRGTKEPEPSVKLRYSNDKFGMEGGYDLELFSDYIGESHDSKDGEDQQAVESDNLLDRRGFTCRLNNPISPSVIRQTSASVSLERTSTLAGYQEGVGSASFTAGPFLKELPMDARSNLFISATTGTRVADVGSDGPDSPVVAYKVMPYALATATTRQIFPFAVPNGRRPITLALQHMISGSSPNIPRQDGIALGVSGRVRGYDSKKNGLISNSLVGTTEVRIPVTLPTDKVRQDATVVVFADWLIAQKNARTPFFRKSSVGIGLRKTIQGIPCKYDLSYTLDGRIRGMFGLGRDFDV